MYMDAWDGYDCYGDRTVQRFMYMLLYMLGGRNLVWRKWTYISIVGVILLSCIKCEACIKFFLQGLSCHWIARMLIHFRSGEFWHSADVLFLGEVMPNFSVDRCPFSLTILLLFVPRRRPWSGSGAVWANPSWIDGWNVREPRWHGQTWTR